MNHKNPAIKRILADVKELHKHPSSRYSAAPLEDNMFEWHFTIRGPKDSAFEGGMYHGRILLPSEYPFKPPNIVFLTKNGRFEVGTKICLSISAYHEETWQPAWGVRTMLEAIISFLPSEGAGAIGALDWTKEERKKLALESRSYCCTTCGAISALLSDPSEDPDLDAAPDSDIAQQVAQLQMTKLARQSSEKAPGSSSLAVMSDMASPGSPGHGLKQMGLDMSVHSPAADAGMLAPSNTLDSQEELVPTTSMAKEIHSALSKEDNSENETMFDVEVDCELRRDCASVKLPANECSVGNVPDQSSSLTGDSVSKKLFEDEFAAGNQAMDSDGVELVVGAARCDAIESKEAEGGEAEPNSELRRRTVHSMEGNVTLEHQIAPEVVQPVAAPRVAVNAPAVVARLDVIDQILDLAIKVVGAAIICLVYRITNRVF